MAQALALMKLRTPIRPSHAHHAFTLLLQQCSLSGSQRDQFLSLRGLDAVIMMDAIQMVRPRFHVAHSKQINEIGTHD
jgi:hypothetical protein